ncbi:MAG: hypothetical protein KAG94_02210 [Clostridiales bacterium]|nr:hypothetical protein [Clostridiales bacterium]
MKKISVIIVIIVISSLLLTACSSKTLEIKTLDGTLIEVSTEGLSDEQIDALEDVQNDKISLKELMLSGLFTQEHLSELGLTPNQSNIGLRGNGEFDRDQVSLIPNFTDIDINDLNLEGLSDEQVGIVKQLLNEEVTLQEVISAGVLANEDLRNMGLISTNAGGRGGMGGSGKQNTDDD